MRLARPVLALRASASRTLAPASRAAPFHRIALATTRSYSQTAAVPEAAQPEQKEPQSEQKEQQQQPPKPKQQKQKQKQPKQQEKKTEQKSTPSPTGHKRVTIKHKNHGEMSVPVAWLRDNCPQSCSPTSGNKNFATAEIPENIDIKSIETLPEDGLRIEWVNDIPRFASQNHVTTFTGKQLDKAMRRNGDYMNKRAKAGMWIMPPLLWDRLTLQSRVLRVPYAEWMAGGDAFFKAVAEIQLTGLVFVTDVPSSKDAVADIGLRFGALQETFYGRTWDVISKPAAENVAYTSEYLGLHSDMLYLTSPPRLQLLHCLENEAEGGESLFSDGGRSARELRMFYPELAKVLEEQPIGYHYEANGFTYHQERPVIQAPRNVAGRPTRGLIRPWWSPPFQAAFNPPSSKKAAAAFETWHTAARQFQALIEDPEAVYRHRLQPGECAVFDNGRILHGRTAFDPATGPRHLRGTYVHEDEWKSTILRVPRDHLSEASADAFGPRTSADLFTTLRYIKYRHLNREDVSPPPTLFDKDTRTPKERKAGGKRPEDRQGQGQGQGQG
ncbi:taurine catabolism dioxygenase [Plectosphaerella plurivora]|uniref:Taurine catabolism dioxygenase n=1 Tax=Plectosphaerella plurivora TaxID=936078 RepID=A0A9P8VGD2_9PEZI|nr:taurine catabolism dioxygenase [Plectosphaerella plurivora]